MSRDIFDRHSWAGSASATSCVAARDAVEQTTKYRTASRNKELSGLKHQQLRNSGLNTVILKLGILKDFSVHVLIIK